MNKIILEYVDRDYSVCRLTHPKEKAFSNFRILFMTGSSSFTLRVMTDY